MQEQNTHTKTKSTAKHTWQWQEYALLALIIAATLFYANIFADFNQLPSEYYGGDHYAHLASAWKTYETYNPLQSPHYYDELQHYPWLTPAVIAVLAWILPITPFVTAIYFPILVIILTIVIVYYLGKHYFNHKTWALLLTATWAVQLIPSMHPSEITKQLFVPLIILMLLILQSLGKETNTKEKTKKQKQYLTGIILALCFLQHIVAGAVALAATLLFIFFTAVEKKAITAVKEYILPLCIGALGALLYWLPLLIVYKGQTVNEWQIFSSESLYPSADFLFNTVLLFKGASDASVAAALFLFFTALCIVYGIYKNDKRIITLLIVFTATVVCIIHPYITYPLFGASLGYYRFPIVLIFLRHLVFMTGVWYAYTILRAVIERRKKEYAKYTSYVVVALLIIWTCMTAVQVVSSFQESERFNYAVEENSKIAMYQELQENVADVIQDDDVVLAPNTDAMFLFNAMTGANVLATRITHATPFVDHNRRTADLAIMLYGDDEQKRQELYEQYNIKWYVQEVGDNEREERCLLAWAELESWSKQDVTTKAYWCIQTDPVYKQELEAVGIETATAYVRLASGDKDVPLTKVLLIKPKDRAIQYKEAYGIDNAEGVQQISFASVI